MQATVAQLAVLDQLEENMAESYLAMCEIYPDPYQAAAALYCRRDEMERATSQLFDAGPLAWMQIVPESARKVLRQLGF